MRYRDLNHQYSQRKPRVRPNSGVAKPFWRSKAVLVVVSLVVVLFGLKLMLTPVVAALANVFRDSTASISYFINRDKLKQDRGVTNFLLIGVDQRAAGGPTLTDTIVLASYRHVDKQISMLSFPRDLWVKVPAFGDVYEQYTKINAVYSLGEEYGYKGGGVELLKEVLITHVGVPIQYYAKVNFEGFRSAIDVVNGVDVYVENAFVDYQYPREGLENAPWSARWEIVSFEQGWQHMDGDTALKYARSRHAYGPEGSDFARARRQQKVILALKDKIMSGGTLLDLGRVKELYLTLVNELDTNITLTEVPLFYRLVGSIEDFSAIKTYVLTDGDGKDGLLYVPDAADFGGAFVLLPRGGWPVIQQFVDDSLYSRPDSVSVN